jgi:L-alanine-DL-glutamate epimerase-like enolase superfamily enzyme
VPWKSKLLTNADVVDGSEMLLPTGAGWGTKIDEVVVRAHPPKM